MRSSLRVVLSASVLSLAVAACGGNRNEKIDYKTPGADTSVKTDSLIVPPDLVTPRRDERFVVPDTPGSATYSGYTAATAAPGAAAAKPAAAVPVAADKVRMERFGNTRWLVLQGNSEQLWPKLRDFWKELGFVLVKDDQQLLIMETDWAENRAKVYSDPVRNALSYVLGSMVSNGERDRYRTRIEQGARPGEVEIYITHRGLEEKMYNPNMGNQTGTYFELQPSNPEMEAEMLTRLMIRLGRDETSAREVVAEVAKPVAERATLGAAADGSQQLTVKDGLDRSWRQVGLALDRIGVVVEDRDRAKGLYFVRYVSAEDLTGQKKESGGWFSGWFGSGKKESGTDQFRVAVSAAGEQTVVQLQDKEGKPASTEASRQILGLLHKELK
ncbi:outer membrane protein assembly factor BamC [Uliginosibacterium aquaticum]|uniref:Outer membrane protein assembly factor BamC n=1 Tax=Uliginosibacterium aquaticum TaxID=2731212 RepID=A0ABX2IIF7_9RHOO|nr:outer membrane protein assembly factor BamC [Uliginosibacterium aquaticum]NSL54143.1 outer membrane protein assembly factor BamC [Uliginosibacterium aquaticum]